MRSLPQALFWEMLAHGRWLLPCTFLGAIMLPLLIYGALSGFQVETNSHEFIVLQFAFLPLVVFQLACGIQMAQGSPSRFYALPISTSSIVTWNFVSGAILLAVETALVACLLNALFDVHWPILGPALFAAAAWSTGQVLMSVSSQQSLPGFCAAGAPSVLLLLWLQTRYGAWFSAPTSSWSEVAPAEAATVLGIFVGCFVMTNWCINLARCGERLPTMGIGSWLSGRWDAFLRSRADEPPFRSQAAAQFWFEWRTKGLALPLVTILILTVAAIVAFGLWMMQADSLGPMFGFLVSLGPFLAVLGIPAGILLGFEVDAKSVGQREPQLADAIDIGSLETGMGSFLASRPITNRDLANAILRTAALSSFLAWIMWFAVFLGCLFLLWWRGPLSFSLMASQTEIDESILSTGQYRALYFAFTLLSPWAVMANLSAIGLSGRGGKLFVAIVGSFVGYCLLIGVVNNFTSKTLVMMIQNVAITIASAVLVFATIWAYYLASRHRHLTLRTCFAALSTIALLVTITVALLGFSQTFIVYSIATAFLALVVLPFASVPLAIAWNRHRG